MLTLSLPACHARHAVQPRWEQEDAHDFLEYLVDRMHLELLALARADTGGCTRLEAGDAGSSHSRAEWWQTTAEGWMAAGPGRVAIHSCWACLQSLHCICARLPTLAGLALLPPAGAGASAGPQSAAAAAAAANAAKAAAEDEWLTKSGRRLTKRQQLKADSETAVSALFRGTYVRCAWLWVGVWEQQRSRAAAHVARRVEADLVPAIQLQVWGWLCMIESCAQLLPCLPALLLTVSLDPPPYCPSFAAP